MPAIAETIHDRSALLVPRPDIAMASAAEPAASMHGYKADIESASAASVYNSIHKEGPSRQDIYLNGELGAVKQDGDQLPPAVSSTTDVPTTSKPAEPLVKDKLVKVLPSADHDACLQFDTIAECVFRGGAKGRAEGMLGSESFPCQCQFEPGVDDREIACGEDSSCVNRHLYIECNPEDCPCGAYCLNRRFQQQQYAPVQVVKTERKGYGIQATESLENNQLVMEYVGEVLPQAWFVKRAKQYAQEGILHHYFMMLNNDEYIDATKKGSIARFINHSCNPNCVLQKWTVGARVRMGIFTMRTISPGEEITFDYKLERYGSVAQSCFCGEDNCKGYIGGDSKSGQKALDLEFAFLDIASVDGDDEYATTTQSSATLKRKRGRPRRMGDDSDDYMEDDEGSLEPKARARGIQSIEQVEKFVPLMMKYANQLEYANKLLLFLDMTESQLILRHFMNTHGLQVLKIYLSEYKHNEALTELILRQMSRLPLTIRNRIEACRVDRVVEEFLAHENPSISQLATRLLDTWKDLKVVYKIPKRARRALPNSASPQTGTNEKHTASHENAWGSTHSSERLGSHADEHGGRAWGDEDDRASGDRSPTAAHARYHRSWPRSSNGNSGSGRGYNATHYHHSPAAATAAAVSSSSSYYSRDSPPSRYGHSQQGNPTRSYYRNSGGNGYRSHGHASSSPYRNGDGRSYGTERSVEHYNNGYDYRRSYHASAPNGAANETGMPYEAHVARNRPASPSQYPAGSPRQSDSPQRAFHYAPPPPHQPSLPAAADMPTLTVQHEAMSGELAAPGQNPLSPSTNRSLPNQQRPLAATIPEDEWAASPQTRHVADYAPATSTPYLKTPSVLETTLSPSTALPSHYAPATDGSDGAGTATMSASSPAQPLQPQPALPPNWRAAESADGTYYYNTATGQTQWERPDLSVPDENANAAIPESSGTVAALAANEGYSSSEHPYQPDGMQNTNGHPSEQANRPQSSGNDEPRTRPEMPPLPPIDERLLRELRARVTEVVVKCLSKYKIEFGDTDRFKKEAKKMAEIMIEKERRSDVVRAGRLPDIDDAYRNRAKRFVKDCMTRFRAKAVSRH